METSEDRAPQDIRSRSIDDFESLFRSAETPVIDVPDVPLERVLAVVEPSRDPRSEAVVGIATRAAERFRPAVLCLTTVAGEDEVAAAQERVEEVAAAVAPYAAEVEARAQTGLAPDLLAEVVDTWVPSLIVVPCPYREAAKSLRGYSLGAAVDVIVRGRDVPTLLVKDPVADPAGVFTRPLVYLPSASDLAGQAALAFSLAEDGGEVHALHVIDEQFLRLDAEVVRLDPDTESEVGVQSYRRALQRQAESAVAAVVAAAESRPFSATGAAQTGVPVAACREAITQARSSLLIVDTEVYSHASVRSAADELVLGVDEVPVLVT